MIRSKNINSHVSRCAWRSRAALICRLLVATLMFGSLTVQAQYDHVEQLPDLGSQAAIFLSEADAAKLGRSFIRQSRYQQPYVSDPELVDYINRLGNKLLEASKDAGRPYRFYLIDNNVINAFAVPGGFIALHTAILTKSETESELASVIAHEISHVSQRHIARKLENSRYDSIIALGALLAAVAAGGGDAAQAALGVANASIIDRQLSYSRAFEAEADSLGIRLLSRAGFDPAAMPRFFKRLLDESRINESHAPEFLRSHPLTINRIAESSARVKAYPAQQEPDQSEFLLMQAKAIAYYASDKKQALKLFQSKIDEGDNSLPTHFGYALALTRNGEYQAARQKFSELLQQYPGHASLRLAQADNELEANNINPGLALLENLYKDETAKGNHLYDIYYANALVLTENHKTAIPIIRSALANDAEEPYFHILLSRAYAETGDEMRSFFERGEYHYLSGNYNFAVTQFKRAEKLAESTYDKARLEARIKDVETELAELKKL
ncbi:MAG: M48 family metallopeptidase [Gammaproteobacteria bacterium]|nr:M48 family metallopeptidase [Gammaproteobacteria bacterium]